METETILSPFNGHVIFFLFYTIDTIWLDEF